jgi:predicted nuclease with RNAse H fold
VRTLGLHLIQPVDLVDRERSSVIAELDSDGALAALTEARHIAGIVAALPAEQSLVACDAPLVVSNDRGRRDVDELLAWCDVPAFPVSRTRLDRVYSGHRGGELLAALDPATTTLVEVFPDQLLRQMLWEETQPGHGIDLARYRETWIGLRPPVFRPKGAGRARPAGIAQTHALVARHVDLGGWAPQDDPDDWQAIADAGVLDAVVCAWAARQALTGPGGRTVRVGAEQPGHPMLVVDTHLLHRLGVNAERLASEGRIAQSVTVWP